MVRALCRAAHQFGVELHGVAAFSAPVASEDVFHAVEAKMPLMVVAEGARRGNLGFTGVQVYVKTDFDSCIKYGYISKIHFIACLS